MGPGPILGPVSKGSIGPLGPEKSEGLLQEPGTFHGLVQSTYIFFMPETLHLGVGVRGIL